MEIKKLTDGFSVAGQLQPEQMPDVAALGFKSLICNRPDGEADDQPTWAAVEAAARAVGLQTRFIPIIHRVSGMDEARQTAAALSELPGPILAFCRTGARSETFYNAATQLVG